MKIITYRVKDQELLGLVHNDSIIAVKDIDENLPQQMEALLQSGTEGLAKLQLAYQKHIEQNDWTLNSLRFDQIEILAPVPKPSSFRDAYAFRQHVETSRANRGLTMIPEFDEFPVFYFSNHHAINGPGVVYGMDEHFDKMDFELEVAVVINKAGRNIKAADADDYIAGYMIMNDLSARRLQMDEMKLNLGPAKGKDFATAIGPYLVTKDELTAYRVETREGHVGETYDLQMTCFVNDVQVSTGSLASMHWTFAEIIERISYGVNLYPGDLIGSGTVGTGCFLELNGTGKRQDPNYREQWLQPGDQVRMEVTALGTLTNTLHLEKF